MNFEDFQFGTLVETNTSSKFSHHILTSITTIVVDTMMVVVVVLQYNYIYDSVYLVDKMKTSDE